MKLCVKLISEGTKLRFISFLKKKITFIVETQLPSRGNQFFSVLNNSFPLELHT